jgi:hypothetical protein
MGRPLQRFSGDAARRTTHVQLAAPENREKYEISENSLFSAGFSAFWHLFAPRFQWFARQFPVMERNREFEVQEQGNRPLEWVTSCDERQCAGRNCKAYAPQLTLRVIPCRASDGLSSEIHHGQFSVARLTMGDESRSDFGSQWHKITIMFYAGKQQKLKTIVNSL